MIGELVQLQLRELDPDATEPSYTGAFRDACRLTGDPALVRRFKGCCVITKSKAPFKIYEAQGVFNYYYKRSGNSRELMPLFPTPYKNVFADSSSVKYEIK